MTIVIFILVLPVRLFVAEPFVVSGSSMSPHYNSGDYLFIQKLDSEYRKDEVVVFESSLNHAYLIKRIVALPTDKVSIKDGRLIVNGIVSTDQYIAEPISGNVDMTLGADEYFVLSDNSIASLDSRTLGPVKKSQIVGKVATNLGKVF